MIAKSSLLAVMGEWCFPELFTQVTHANELVLEEAMVAITTTTEVTITTMGKLWSTVS